MLSSRAVFPRRRLLSAPKVLRRLCALWLTEGTCYPVQAEVGNSGGYSWVRIFVAGVQRYAAVLADRCRLVTLSPGDAFAACVAQGGGEDTAELEAQLEAANARADEADKRLADVKSYVAGV